MNAPASEAALQPSALPLDQIVPSNTHIQLMRRERFSAALLQDLARSITEIGVLQPVVVRRGNGRGALFELVAGERRWLAARIAGLTEIPATVRDLTDEQVLKAQLVENLQREGLHELEEAEGYGELMKLDALTGAQVADMIGKSRSYVSARLKLLALGPEARKAFYSGEIDYTRAFYIARVTNPKLQAKALALALEKGWKGDPQYSVRGLREKLRGAEFSVTLKTAPFAQSDTSFFELVQVKKGKQSVGEPRALPDCVSCPNRTGNCLDLFNQDDDPDVCMDPACYAVKIRQHGERLRKQVEESGIKVISGAEAKKIAPRKNELDGYVDLDAVCEDDEYPEPEPEYPRGKKDQKVLDAYDAAQEIWQEKAEAFQGRTFRQLLQGTPVNAVVIEDPSDGRIRTLVPFKEAKQAVKKQHKIDLNDWHYGQRHHGPVTAGESAEEKSARLKKEEAQRARQEQEALFRKHLLTEVHAKGHAPLKRDDLCLIADKLLADYDVEQDAEEFFGKIPKTGNMKEAELLQLIRFLLVSECLEVHTAPQLLLDLARRLKIDPDKIKKELKAAGEGKPKAETTKNAKKKAAPAKGEK